MGRRGCVHGCVPDEMVTIEGDSSKDQLKSVSMGSFLANDVL